MLALARTLMRQWRGGGDLRRGCGSAYSGSSSRSGNSSCAVAVVQYFTWVGNGLSLEVKVKRTVNVICESGMCVSRQIRRASAMNAGEVDGHDR